ncbi:MerR family transcriptional regulator [Heyndrickxia acidicola]|uniref:MerR family transcriptional regulator n=1 Tax=Heyndrickxia acidicola TaxID=209389 RepID=A0ABU6MLL6_9BACI|nr:MerR family transcriptional regulator [Heyndrickxia acidicola]MED1204122.1 MerR family transcriptional regulator [Heyndrickxia acidicola]
MKIKEVADLVGISVRALHHYDEIGLLVPDKITEAGYRLYSERNLETLQQILFFRELGFPLKKIKEIINRPSFDRQKALEIQHGMLLEKRDRLDRMITTIEKTILNMKGEIHMSNKEKFEGFSFDTNPYEQEARERWGDQAVDDVGPFSNEEKKELSNDMNQIYRELAGLRKKSPATNEAQGAIGKWYGFLNKHFGHYSYEAFKGLGQLYVQNSRFEQNIDQFGEGLAAFMAEAMAIFADNRK